MQLNKKYMQKEFLYLLLLIKQETKCIIYIAELNKIDLTTNCDICVNIFYTYYKNIRRYLISRI